MTDRDTFAAAALTGMLRPDDVHSEFGSTNYKLRACRMAYDWADAMLRERGKTNHDAAPEARASEATASPERVCVRGNAGTGNTHAPVAQSAEQRFCEPFGAGSTPAGGSPEPVAWAVIVDGEVDNVGGCEALYIDREDAVEWAADYRIRGRNEVVPLYRHPQPTLTDAEREAVGLVIQDYGTYTEEYNDVVFKVADTLRKLLERLGGGR